MNPLSRLPHRFPFRFVGHPVGGRVLVQLGVGDRLPRPVDPRTPYPLTLAIEIMAQAAMLVLPAPPGREHEELRGSLAGVEQGRWHHPVFAGARLWAGANPLGRFATLTKAACWLETEGQGRVAEAHLLLHLER